MNVTKAPIQKIDNGETQEQVVEVQDSGPKNNEDEDKDYNDEHAIEFWKIQT